MDDLISRQAAIDAIMCEPTDAHYPSWYAERLEQLPSAQPEPQWIPCTPDTMPSENDAYIVTCVGEGTKWTDVAEYSKRHKGWRYGLHSDNIIAWMPLPKPWEGGPDEH